MNECLIEDLHTSKHLPERRVRPKRLTPLHTQHLAANASMVETGHWLRPAFYGDSEERRSAIQMEVGAVCGGVALIDVSTVGKIEVNGPDAARLLDASYNLRMSNLKTGTTRCALLVDEEEVIVDDGIVARFAEDHFYVTTTTRGAAASYRTLLHYIREWNLDVHLVNRTGELAALNLAGPDSRKLLQALINIDLDEKAFPYLGAREAEVAGMPARLIRVGFVGKLCYEIHLHADHAEKLWRSLMEAGSYYSIRPFGLEAQRLLQTWSSVM